MELLPYGRYVSTAITWNSMAMECTLCCLLWYEYIFQVIAKEGEALCLSGPTGPPLFLHVNLGGGADLRPGSLGVRACYEKGHTRARKRQMVTSGLQDPKTT